MNKTKAKTVTIIMVALILTGAFVVYKRLEPVFKQVKPHTDKIFLEFGNEESYYLYLYDKNDWEKKSNGYQNIKSYSLNFIMREGYIEFYTSDPVDRIYAISHEGDVEYVSDNHFIYYPEEEIPEYLIFNITYKL